MAQSSPRFFRIGAIEIMVEKTASFLSASQWHKPSAMQGAVTGERLYWFGPFHVAIGPWHP
jgi:hypothetical protein